MKLSDHDDGVTGVHLQAGPGKLARRTLVFLLLSIVSGLLIGVLTLLGQGVLPDDALQLSNSGAVWVVVAFALGRFAPFRQVALFAGFVALVGELTGYFAAAQFIVGAASSVGAIAIWFLVALVAGPLFGYAGFISLKGESHIRKLGNAALGAAFVGEGLYLMTILPKLQTGIIWLVIALLIVLILNRTATARLQGALVSAGLGIVFFGCMRLLLVIDSLRASGFTG